MEGTPPPDAPRVIVLVPEGAPTRGDRLALFAAFIALAAQLLEFVGRFVG
jgi:hypothetical protein